jgi:hypothetical protein
MKYLFIWHTLPTSELIRLADKAGGVKKTMRNGIEVSAMPYHVVLRALADAPEELTASAIRVMRK